MSQQNKQTSILNLNNQISNEEDDIVNKIIHELNDGDDNNNNNNKSNSINVQQLDPAQQMQAQQMQAQQMQAQQMQAHQMQGGQMQGGQMQGGQMQGGQIQDPQIQGDQLQKNDKNLFKELTKYSKEIIFIVIVSFMFTLPFMDNILKSFKVSLIISDDNINSYGKLLKCILIGLIYFIFKYMS